MKTPSDVKADMHRRGETVASWARKHNVSANLVSRVLNGGVKCRYGSAHKIAVLLGIKNGEIVEDEGHEHA